MNSTTHFSTMPRSRHHPVKDRTTDSLFDWLKAHSHLKPTRNKQVTLSLHKIAKEIYALEEQQ